MPYATYKRILSASAAAATACCVLAAIVIAAVLSLGVLRASMHAPARSDAVLTRACPRVRQTMPREPMVHWLRAT